LESDGSDFAADAGFSAGLSPDFSEDDEDDSGFRLSLIYQPDPLKTTPTGWNTLRSKL
jgi:hypothetical protein